MSDVGGYHRRKGTVIMLHGWAQNAWVMKSRTKKLEKRLNQAGYDCAYLEAPHILPMTSMIEIEGQKIQLTNGQRENARAWFMYSDKDHADTSLSLEEIPMNYVGLDSSILHLKDFLSQLVNDQFCAILGFSQGATFCHILSTLAAAKRVKPHSGVDASPFSKIDCSILLSGFTSMHKGPLCDGVHISNDALDCRSLHIYGEKDTSVPIFHGQKLARRFLDAETYIHPKGHVIPQNRDLSDKIICFLDSESKKI